MASRVHPRAILVNLPDPAQNETFPIIHPLDDHAKLELSIKALLNQSRPPERNPPEISHLLLNGGAPAGHRKKKHGH